MPMFRALNHVLDVNLTQPIGRRTKAVLLAALAVILLAQSPLFAQSQTDCVGAYEAAVKEYYGDLMIKISEAENNYAWYNPMRTVMVNAAGIEYYARCESAMCQMIACSAAPIFKVT